MNIISRFSKETNIEKLLLELTEDLKDEYDLGFLFIAGFNREESSRIAKDIQTNLNVKNLLGCSCSGIVSSFAEIEQKPSCSIILYKFNDVKVSTFYLNQNRLDQIETKEDWYDFLTVYPTEDPNFLILPDPFLIDIKQILQGLNEAYPQRPILGGLASGGNESKENVIFINDHQYDEGLVGVHLTGNIEIETIVSQGCRPIGENYIVTRAEGNIIYELGGHTLYEVLEEAIIKATDRERMLAQEAIFVGIAMDEYKHKLRRGDFLIRLLVGIDKESGAGAIADYIEQGQTIQFHIRDAITATEDLTSLLKEQVQRHPDHRPHGALLFSCTGRGEGLFHEKDHDISLIQNHIGQVPAAGFFCAGEIGPVAGKNFIHGFTNSIALFYPKNNGRPQKHPVSNP